MKVTVFHSEKDEVIENVKLIRQSNGGDLWLCADKSGSSISVILVVDPDHIVKIEED